MRRTLTALMAGTAVAALAGGGIAEAQTTLRMANWLPPAHPLMANIMVPWAESVEEATGGSVEIEVMAAPLGPPPAHFDFASQGAADITYGVHNYTPGRFTAATLPDLPFMAPSSAVLSVAYWRVFEEYLAEANEHEGTHVLGVFVHGPGHVYTTEAPFETVDGLENVKIRVGGGMAQVVAEALGAVPVQAPVTEAYQILSTGIAEGILFPAESIPAFNLHEVVRYGTEIPGGLYNTSFFVVMNQAKWDSLTPEEQEAIESVSGEVLAQLAGEAWDAADADGVARMEEAGVELTVADEAFAAELHSTLEPVIAETLEGIAAKGIDAQAAYDALLAEVEAVQAE